jgi:hypothetical protein
LVNEITPDGKVVHLTSLYPPKKHQQTKPAPEEPVRKVEVAKTIPVTTTVEVTAVEGEAVKPVAESTDAAVSPETKEEFKLSAEDEVLLDKYFGAGVREQIVKLYEKILAKPNEKAAAYGSVTSEPILDRELRTKLHQVCFSRLHLLTGCRLMDNRTCAESSHPSLKPTQIKTDSSVSPPLPAVSPLGPAAQCINSSTSHATSKKAS